MTSSAQDHSYDVALGDRQHVTRFLIKVLYAIDRLDSTMGWSDEKRDVFVKLIEDYSKGKYSAVKTVHSELGLMPEEVAALSRQYFEPVRLPSTRLTTIQNLARLRHDSAQQVKSINRLLEIGAIRMILIRAGIRDCDAIQLEADFLTRHYQCHKNVNAKRATTTIRYKSMVRWQGLHHLKDQVGAVVMKLWSLIIYMCLPNRER